MEIIKDIVPGLGFIAVGIIVFFSIYSEPFSSKILNITAYIICGLSILLGILSILGGFIIW